MSNRNKLSDFFFTGRKKLVVDKWHHYFDIYDAFFKKFIDKEPTILEIGVQRGGSLEMWNHYFDGKCKIYGIDIDPACKNIEKYFSNVTVLIGDQNDDDFINKIVTEIPVIDILIDDGSHIQSHLIKCFEKLYNNISPGGIYLIEDLHTSYSNEHGGGLRNPNSFIEYSKLLIDALHSFYIPGADRTFATKTNALHYYDSVLVVEKKVVHKNPQASARGDLGQIYYQYYVS